MAEKKIEKNAENTSDKKEWDEDSKRFYVLLHTIFNICNLSGYRLEGRLKVRDLKTGKVFE